MAMANGGEGKFLSQLPPDCSSLTSIDRLRFLFARADPNWLVHKCCQEHQDQGLLLGHCLPLCLAEAQRAASDPPRLLASVNTLVRITAILCDFASSPPPAQSHFDLLLSRSLSLCLHLLDFPSALSVGHSAVAALANLVQLHAGQCSLCQCSSPSSSASCHWLLSLAHTLVGQRLGLSKIRAKALHNLLAAHPQLRELILTPAFVAALYPMLAQPQLAVQLSHLLVADICAILRNPSGTNGRLGLHIGSIRQTMLDREVPKLRLAVEQKFLPVLLAEPEARAWFLNGGGFAALTVNGCPSDSAAQSLHSQCLLARLAVANWENRQLGWVDLIPEETLERALLYRDDFGTRLCAWSLLCDHPKGARPVSATELRLSLRFIARHFHLSQPAQRNAVFARLDNLLSRIRQHSASLLKLAVEGQNQQHLDAYKHFLCSLQWIAFEHLPSTSEQFAEHTDEEDSEHEEEEEKEGDEKAHSFSERIFSLTLLSKLLVPIGQYDYLLEHLGQHELAKLVVALDDRFELCQTAAIEMLNSILSVERKTTIWDFSPLQFFERTKMELLFACPHLPWHQQAMEYRLRFVLPRLDAQLCHQFVVELLDLVGQQLKICESFAKNDNNALSPVAHSVPQLHSLFSALHTSLSFSLSHLLDSKSNFGLPLDSLLSLCHSSAQLIAPVVHSLSPEGFLPPSTPNSDSNGPQKAEEENGNENADFGTARLLSRTCWRTHKAISHIFALLIENMPSADSLLSAAQLTQIGTYFLTQLTECRHCGAFEAAAAAFRSVCVRFWAFSSPSPADQLPFPCAPGEWLRQIVNSLVEKSVSRRLCLTRRSAGLPHLICVFLSTEPDTGKRDFPLFHWTMRELLNCRLLEDRELEVHCANVLRLLFAHSQFAERVLPHVDKAFQVVLDGCAEEHWQVRNAHTQLFAALVKRVFGTPAQQQRSIHVQLACTRSAHDFFSRHPSLHSFLLDRIQQLDCAFSNITASSKNGKPAFGGRHLFLAFPLLLVLGHLRPSPLFQQHSLRPFLPHLLRLLLSVPGHSLRELSSAAILAISNPDELQKIVCWIWQQIDQKQGNGGHLLQNSLDAVQILVDQLDQFGGDKIGEAKETVDLMRDWIKRGEGRRGASQHLPQLLDG